MKTKWNTIGIKSLTFSLLIILFSNAFYAQTDSLLIEQPDQKVVEEKQGKEKKQKKDRKRKDEFKVFVGANFNQLNITNERYYSNIGVGWDFGFTYKRGRFFYWEIGARYNNPVYILKDNQVPSDSSSLFDGVFGVRQIDVPITGGINFLSVTSRIVGLRVYVSAIPSFALGVGSNDLGITKDDLNSFIFYGQGGVGVDIAFIYLEGGVNYGFTNLFKTDFQSNPIQLFVNLGFRF